MHLHFTLQSEPLVTAITNQVNVFNVTHLQLISDYINLCIVHIFMKLVHAFTLLQSNLCRDCDVALC